MTDFKPAMNPDGGAVPGRLVTQPALDMDLMELVVGSQNMHRAWKRVKANRGAPGVDGMTLEEADAWLRMHWPATRESLLAGTYQPQPLRRVAIPKRSGGERLLGIPAVVDRLIQQAIAQVLGPRFDPDFSASSYGFRPGRSAHGAIRQVQAYGKAGYFGISDYYRPVPETDHWLRRGLRMCYWKQWRRPRTRIRHLLSLGTSRKHAILTGLSRKGYWHLAKTLATQSGMTNEWLAEQGLVSIRARWMTAHGYTD